MGFVPKRSEDRQRFAPVNKDQLPVVHQVFEFFFMLIPPYLLYALVYHNFHLFHH